MSDPVKEAWLALAGTRVKDGFGIFVEPLEEPSLSSDSSDTTFFFTICFFFSEDCTAQHNFAHPRHTVGNNVKKTKKYENS